MRRKLMTIAGVLLVLGTLFAAELLGVRMMAEDALYETEKIRQAVLSEDFATAAALSQALDEAWDRQMTLLETMIDHKAADEVRFALSGLRAAIEAQDRTESLILAAQLQGSVEHVRARQSLTIANIF